jgi:hypothetical protein
MGIVVAGAGPHPPARHPEGTRPTAVRRGGNADVEHRGRWQRITTSTLPSPSALGEGLGVRELRDEHDEECATSSLVGLQQGVGFATSRRTMSRRLVEDEPMHESS